MERHALCHETELEHVRTFPQRELSGLGKSLRKAYSSDLTLMYSRISLESNIWWWKTSESSHDGIGFVACASRKFFRLPASEVSHWTKINKLDLHFKLIEAKLMFVVLATLCCSLCTFLFLKFKCCATDAFVYLKISYVHNTHNWPVSMKVLSESRYFFMFVSYIQLIIG